MLLTWYYESHYRELLSVRIAGKSKSEIDEGLRV